MSSSYNSQLISALYREATERKVKDILSEMEEVKDPIFIWPIYDAYRRFKESSIAHYFLSSLREFDSNDALKATLMVVKERSFRKDLFPWAFPIFSKNNIFDDRFVAEAVEVVKNISTNFEDSYLEYDLESSASYLVKANKLDLSVKYLKNIYLSDRHDKNLREKALFFLLRDKLSLSATLNYFIENYGTIRDQKSEIILAEEIVSKGWHGTKIDKLKKFILESDNRASEVIIASQKESLGESIKEAERLAPSFNNSQKIETITSLRAEINRKSLSLYGFDFFPPNELLIRQLQPAASEAMLIKSCIDLRSFINDFSEDVHVDPAEESELAAQFGELKNLAEGDLKKSINKFLLFLKSRKVNVDANVFGLRSLNRVLSLVGHPEEKVELQKLLRIIGLSEQYTQGKWSDVHIQLLNLVVEYLTKLNSALE